MAPFKMPLEISQEVFKARIVRKVTSTTQSWTMHPRIRDGNVSLAQRAGPPKKHGAGQESLQPIGLY